jgi:hypothetical protein
MDPFFLRLHGPGKFRFIVQPLIAIVLGVRDGIQDAKAGKSPYFWHLVFDSQRRRELWKEGWKAISFPLILAFALDSLFQVMVLSRWRPLGALAVGAFLVALPYASARGLANRAVSRRYGRRAGDSHGTNGRERRAA